MRGKLALVFMVIVLALVNWSIAGKERHLAEGNIVLLELAPIDPRSLMQGDYMALRFKLANEVYGALPKEKGSRRWRQKIAASDGKVIVTVDERSIGTFVRIDHGLALAANELVLKYRVRNGKIKFATNAFFFQERKAGLYQSARFGQLRVDDTGGDV